MAFTKTAVLHQVGYDPPGPASEQGRRVHLLEEHAPHCWTVIGHDDGDPPPAGVPGAGEVARWSIPVGVEPANYRALRRQARDVAMPRLGEIVDATDPTGEQVVDAVKDLARILRQVIRLLVGGDLLDTTD